MLCPMKKSSLSTVYNHNLVCEISGLFACGNFSRLKVMKAALW